MKPTLNTLVLYKNNPAVITAVSSDKIDIDTPSGTKRVREKDYDPLGSAQVSSLKAVLSAKAPPADLAEAADFFTGEQPDFTAILELAWGSIPGEQVWDAWQTLCTHPRFDCSGPASITIRSAEEAQAISDKLAARQRDGSEREGFVERLTKKKGQQAGLINPETDARFLQEIEALALGKTDKCRLLKDAGRAETAEEAHRVLLDSGFWSVWRNPWPYRQGLTVRSATVPVASPADTDVRLDLTHLESWAIDNAWSADPDDAVCMEGDSLWVHIADPASSVTPDSPADLEARARGSTLYLPEGAARMLEDRSLEWFALGLSPSSRALSFKLSFNQTGGIEDVSIHRTLVRVTRLTYTEADRRKDESGLAPLFAIAERNLLRRRAAGAIDIELPEIHLSVTLESATAGEVHIETVHPTSSSGMVREMMLLTGEACARYAFKHRIPFQYVSQEDPSIPKDLPQGLAGEYTKRRGMKSRRVGTVPADHAGLGLGMYSQVTSPLRRYGDLIAHQQLHRHLDGLAPLETDEMLERIAQGDAGSRACTQAERASTLHWILVYLSTHPEWSTEAVIVDISGPAATILIPSLGQESKIVVQGTAALNDVLTVRAGNIDIPTQKVTFIPVDKTEHS